MITDIVDVDLNLISQMRSTVVITSNLLFEVSQGVSETFRSEVLGGATLTNLELRMEHRLICTPGSCGPDCTQTTNCIPFPPACPSVCDEPCVNGGICQVSLEAECGWCQQTEFMYVVIASVHTLCDSLVNTFLFQNGSCACFPGFTGSYVCSFKLFFFCT